MPKKTMISMANPHTLAQVPSKSPILVAFSGGADSRALLELLVEYSRSTGTPLSVAHLNHGIRGEDADKDEEFCRMVAESHGLPFYSGKEDIPRLSKESGESLECVGRRERYAFFERIMREHQIPVLATAHNADDNLETVLFHMVRGGGMSGMCGIPPVRNLAYGKVVRPLLQVSKKEILLCCRKMGWEYRTDSTNLDVSYTRNRIRTCIVPELEKIVDCPQEAVSRLTRSVREDDRYLSILAGKALDDCRDGTRLSREKLRAMDAALRKRVLRAWSAMQGLDEWEFVHLEAVNQLITEGRTGQSVSLPGRFRGTVSKEWFWIEPEDVQKPEPFSYEFHKGMPSLEDAGAGFFLSWDEKEFQAYRDELTKKKIHKIDTKLFISKDIIDQVSLVRSYREGDKIVHGNMHKSLRKLLNEKRIPSNYRERLPLLCHEERILAVPFVGGEGCSTDFNKDKTPLYILVFLPEIQ